jgi:hypothetical protein
MTLKQLDDLDRIVFLKKLTAELLINAIKKYTEEQEINIARLTQKFNQPSQEQTFEQIIKLPIFESSEELKEREQIKEQKIKQIQEIQEEKKIQKLEELNQTIIQPSFADRLRRPIFHRIKQRKPIPINQRKIFMTSQIQQAQQITGMPGMQRSIQEPEQQLTKTKPISRPPVEDIREIRLEAEPRPSGFSLGRIEKILRDKSVQSIECSGPGKRILIKKLNRINSSSIVLSQQEITNLIQSFAKQAKIPITGGILKAAVGDMIISAVISEYVGSRFIINKLTPYSILF